jgi:hypothetical protein
MYSLYYQQVKAFKSIAFKLQACQFCNTWLRLCAFREPVTALWRHPGLTEDGRDVEGKSGLQEELLAGNTQLVACMCCDGPLRLLVSQLPLNDSITQ